jgi:hypothetical protein
VDDLAPAESPEGGGVGPVLVRVDLDGLARRDDPGNELLDGPAGGLRVRSPDPALESLAGALLVAGHRARASQLGLVEAINIVRGPNEQLEVEGPVLAELEGPEAVEDQGLARHGRSQAFMQEQTVASEALD